MPSYHIIFRTESSQQDSNYTLWRGAPLILSENGQHISSFSNSISTRNVSKDGTWDIDINDVPYAFCGISPSKTLSIGEQIKLYGNKLVKILPQGNGSTVTVYNNNNIPTFRPDVVYTARPGTFQIMTEDFGEHLNFAVGHSIMDENARPKPQATFKPEPNNSYYVAPNARFYLANFASQPGSLLNYRGVSAEINFDAYPGFSNAIVVHRSDGSFDVKIVSDAVFAMETAVVKSPASASNVQLTQLKHQAKLMSSLIDTALGISTTDDIEGQYLCAAEWVNNPSLRERSEIAMRLAAAMRFVDYKFRSATLQPRLNMVFTHTPPLPSYIVLVKHWVPSLLTLPPELYRYVRSPSVQSIVSIAAAASQIEAVELPAEIGILPRPQWRCSVDWLEGPSDYMREELADQLLRNMGQRGYARISSINGEQNFSADFFHFEPTDLATATADWQATRDEFDPLSRMYAAGPKTESLYHTQATETSQMNGATTNGAPAGIAIPHPEREYLGWVRWLEGPNVETKAAIIRQFVSTLEQQEYSIKEIRDLNGVEALMITFRHFIPSDLARARGAWFDAYNLIKEGTQGMFITGPLCSENGPVGFNQRPSDPAYLGGLTWLEGPSKETRENIIDQLKTTLQAQNNKTRDAIDFDEFLVLPFSHVEPSDLEQAQRDWRLAFESIRGNQRMFITAPFCEKDEEIHLDPIENKTNGANGAVAAPPLSEVQPVAPAVQTFESQSESLEEKKRRALALLQREGLIGFSGLSLA